MSTFQENLKKCVKILGNGNLIIYPTDTFWAIGCDATNKDSIEKIRKLKKETKYQPSTVLVADQVMLECYVEVVPEVAYDILDFAEKPTTIVFDNPKHIASNSLYNDGSVAIRIASDKFCQYLIRKFGKPIIVTEACLSSKSSPINFNHIEDQILKGVDYVVNLQMEKKKEKETFTPATLIKLTNNSVVKIIRR